MNREIRLHGQHRVHGRAHWCIVGYPYEDQCAVLASDTLGRAELTATFAEMEVSGLLGDMPFLPSATYEINVEATNIVFVYADTYAQAVARLFQTWDPSSPDPSHQWAIEPPRQDLPEG